MHMQAPMIPTTIPTFQQNPHSKSQTQAQDTATNATNRHVETLAGGQQDRPSSRRSGDPASMARENVLTFMMHQQVEVPLNEQQESRLNRGTADQFLSVQGNVPTPTSHRQFDQTNGKQCTCYTQPTNGNSNQGVQVTEDGKRNPHTEYEGSGNSGGKSVHNERESGRNGPQECKVIRILPDEEVDFMD